MRKWAVLTTVAMLAVSVFIGGCAQYSALGVDSIEYMGLSYGPSELPMLSADMLYYTGDASGGAKLYAPGWTSPEKVPSLLFIKDALGYRAFSKLADNPPVYAYTPYESYNVGEAVTFGLMDEAGGIVELRNSAPFEVQRRENGEWKTIYQPVAAQVITTLENGTYKAWAWEQQYSGGGKVGTGDYRAVIDGKYEVYFTITEGAPVVRLETTDYDDDTLRNTFGSVPEHAAIGKYYTKYDSGVRDDVAGQMLFKAYMKGADAEKLRSALKTAMADSGRLEMLPCLAVHASYNGRPSWIIVYNWGMGGEGLGHIRYYVVDDATGEIAYFMTCR